MSGLNPKAWLFFLAFLPQFARPTGWPLGLQLAVPGAIWIILAVAFYGLLGLTVRRTLARWPALTSILTRVSGGAMVLAGMALLAEQVVARLG